MLQRPRKETIGREHRFVEVYWIPAVVCGGILWHDTLPPPPFSPLTLLPSLPPPALPLHPLPLCQELTLYYWSSQAFCTFGAPVVKCLQKRIPESADAFFGNSTSHCVSSLIPRLLPSS